MASKCEVRVSHSRTNHAPHPKRNVRQLAKARSESVVSCSDGWDEVHTYGSPTGDCKVPFQRARLWIAWINRHWRPSVDARHRLAAASTLRALLETLTLVLSLCERERRALCAVTLHAGRNYMRTRCYGDSGGRTILDALFRLAQLAGRGLR